MDFRKLAFGIAAIFCFGFPALALDLDEARKLALAGDIDRIEAQFRQHQQDFDNGQIGAEAFKAPYQAFNTTHPKVYQKPHNHGSTPIRPPHQRWRRAVGSLSIAPT